MKTYPDSKQMLSYPLKGLYIIFIETYKRTPKEGKKIAKAFDLINKETKHIHFHKFKKFSFLINNFGLYYGYKLYRFLNHLKTTLSSCIF